MVQVVACLLFVAKLLPEPMLAYCLLDFWEQISVKFEVEFYHFHKKMYLKLSSAKIVAILSGGGGGGDELKDMGT